MRVLYNFYCFEVILITTKQIKIVEAPLFLKSKKKLKKSLTILENILNVNCITFNIFFK
jgi:hypothetical protein